LSPNIKVIAAEPEGADDAHRSFYSGEIVPSTNPKTICDGLLTSLSERTFAIIKQNVNEIVTVSDEFTIKAMKMIWERMKIIIEPSSAVTLGLILEKKIDLNGQKIGIIISGGNVDLNKLISKLISDLSQEEEIIDWSVKLQKSSRKNRFEELKNKGLV